MNEEEKKSKSLLKKIAIPAAVIAAALLLGINAFSAYSYFSVKADNDKLSAQNEEYENSILRLSELSDTPDAEDNTNAGAVCGNADCPYCQGNCTADCKCYCCGCASGCNAYNGVCPWDDEAWLDKFADILESKRLEKSLDLSDADAEDEEIGKETIADDEETETSDSTKKKTAVNSAKRSSSKNSTSYQIDPALQLYYQRLNSAEYRRQLAYYNALRSGYLNGYSYSNSNSGSSDTNSSSDNSSHGSLNNPSRPSGPRLPGYDVDSFRELEGSASRGVYLKVVNEADDRNKEFTTNWDSAYKTAHTITNGTGNSITVENKKHTLILYMLASDLEGKDNDDLTHDIEAFLNNADYDSDYLNVLICVGAAENYRNEYFKKYVDNSDDGSTYNNGCALFYVNMDKDTLDGYRGDGSSDIINNETLLYLGNLVDDKDDNLSELSCSMYKPETLQTVIDIAATNFSADEYSLIMWDHGGGVVGGFGVQKDVNGNSNSMPISDIQEALAGSKVCEDGGKFAFIGFDACLMGGIETASALSPYADYYVASAEITSGGWNYAGLTGYIAPTGADADTADSYLKVTDDADTKKNEKSEALAQRAATLYAEQGEHNNNTLCTDYIVACVDLNAIEPVVNAIESISSHLNALSSVPEIASDYFDIIHRARLKAYSYGNDAKSRDNISYDYVDIKDFYTLLGKEIEGYLADNRDNLPGITIERLNGSVDQINELLDLFTDDPAISKAYASWLGYKDNDGNIEVAGSNPGCFSIYMPFMYSPDPDDENGDYADEYAKYVAGKYINDGVNNTADYVTAYNEFLASYFRSESAHRETMKQNIAPVIDYNRIFSAQVKALKKDSGVLYEYYTTADAYDNGIENLASTVIHFSLKNGTDAADDADEYIKEVAGDVHNATVADPNRDDFSYSGGAFEAFKDTVNKITAVTTQRADTGETDTNDNPVYTDIVVARKDVELADISANSIDIGLNDYAKAQSYQITGKVYYSETDTLDYATPVSSAIMGLMTEMRQQLVTASTGETFDADDNSDPQGLWQAVQGKITKWVNGVKTSVEAAVLHFKADNSDTYEFYGASTVKVGTNTAGEGEFQIDETKTLADLQKVTTSSGTLAADVISYTISFYHYIIGDYVNPVDANDVTSRYMYVTAENDINAGNASNDEKASALLNESAITDSSYSKAVAIEQPEYDPNNLKLTLETLVASDPKNKADAESVYENNSKYGYGALIESTSEDTTAVAPAYIDDSSVTTIGSEAPSTVAASNPNTSSGQGSVSAVRSQSDAEDFDESPDDETDVQAPVDDTADTDISAYIASDAADSTGNILITDVIITETPAAPSPFEGQEISVPTPYVSDNNEMLIVSEQPADDKSSSGSSDDGSDGNPGTEGGGSDGDGDSNDTADAQE